MELFVGQWLKDIFSIHVISIWTGRVYQHVALIFFWGDLSITATGSWWCILCKNIGCFSLERPVFWPHSGGTCLPSSRRQLSPFVSCVTTNGDLHTTMTSPEHAHVQSSLELECLSVLSSRPNAQLWNAAQKWEGSEKLTEVSSLRSLMNYAKIMHN